MLPYLIAGVIGYGISKLFEDKKAPKYADGGLIAPNGKPSNLTPEQYKLVRTTEFKAWFGDWEKDPANASKVVDENGEPMVVYHGTDEKFTIFKDEGVVAKTMGKSVGFYFTPSKWSASRRSIDGDYIEVFLNIKKLFKLKKFSNDEDFIKILGNELKEAIGLPERAETYWYLKNGSGYDGREEYNVGSVVKELSLKKGIEGYYFLEFMSYDEGVVPVYQVFESKNVKLADGTNTTFDGNNPDIRFMAGGNVYTNSFDKWFNNSKVVDKKGNPLIVYHGSPDLRGLKEKYIFKSRFADNQSFFFTDNYSMAKSYADPKNAFDYQNAEEGVIGLYLSLQNPLIVNAFNQIWRKFETTIDGNEIMGTRNLIKFAKDKGYDGVIVENVRDYYNNNEKKTKGGNVYVAFEPTQIKLADGSNTTFDSNNPDIRFEDGGELENVEKYKIFNVQKEGNYINFYIGNNKIGYIEYYYDGGSISEHISNAEDEFYMAMIEVYEEYRGKNYSEIMIEYVKDYAKSLGATIITLRVDYGMGFGSKRNPNYGLEKIYLKNGFKYSFTEEEADEDDTKDLGAMEYILDK